MRKIPIFAKLVVCACLLFFGAALLSGCETCKGIKRDVMKADEWLKDNLW